MNERHDRNPLRSFFGAGDAVRRIGARPQKVRGPIPWEDMRWWAVRRYRPVWAEGPVTLGPWRFVLPVRCGARRPSETTIEFTDRPLSVTVTMAASTPPHLVPDNATRWTSSGISGVTWVIGSERGESESPRDSSAVGEMNGIRDLEGRRAPGGREELRFEYVLRSSDAPTLQVRGTSHSLHDRHWVTALVQSVTCEPIGEHIDEEVSTPSSFSLHVVPPDTPPGQLL